GNAGTFYVDGNEVSTFVDQLTGDLNNSTNLYIGTSEPALDSQYYTGCIDELEIFKRVLTADEIQGIFNARSAGKCKPTLTTPTISPNGGYFTNSVTVTLAGTTLGTSLYYTLDNSTPSTNSTLYAAPFVVTNTTAVKVLAFKAGAVPSAVVSATFINSASLIFSPGFVKQEFYPGATRADLESGTYVNSPTMVNYLSSFETPSGQGSNYAERVSGFFIPPVTGNYVFFIAAGNDSDLFLSTDATTENKRLIAQET